MEQLFWGTVNIQRAAAYFYYHKETMSSEILYRLKYANCPAIGEYMGMEYATEIQQDEQAGKCHFFKGIDYIVPLPLNPQKQKKRGYNQCDSICMGISQVTGIPVLFSVVERVVENATQTKKNRIERGMNVQQIFQLTGSGKGQELLKNKHVLLVDDVCTTGATLKSFASVFQPIPGIKTSILTLGLASPVF